MSELFTKFYQKTLNERLAILEQLHCLSAEELSFLTQQKNLSSDTANQIIENYLTIYGVPLGLAPNFLIDGKLFHAPMATEEPSVIAAASNGAAIIKQAGGFTTKLVKRAMIGQIALYDVADLQEAQNILLKHKANLIEKANQAYPSIVKRGGGAFNLTVEIKEAPSNAKFCIVYLFVDTKEAMGANMLNTMLEAIKEDCEQLTQAKSLMAILSNYATESLVTVSCRIPFNYLSKKQDLVEAEIIANKIEKAYEFACADIYRATTHNKGIMNGVSAVVLATGNDTRAIEAGAHAFASHSGGYQPLTSWKVNNNVLEGSITLPLPIGFVGGSITINPLAQIAQKLSQTTSAKELAVLIASVGLAQNLAALKALVSVGIQKGHMRLHFKSLAQTVGATIEEIPLLVEKLSQLKQVNQEVAKEILRKIRSEK